MSDFHTPVLINEVIEGLRVKDKGLYIDATIGGGGHAERILSLGARVLGIDQDEDAILHLKKKFESEIKSGQLTLVAANFSSIENVAKENGFENVDGILLDLGVSSHQLDEARRGFSFRYDEVLDMRMNQAETLTAEGVVNKYPEESLYEIFAKYGEEPKARAIAHEIVAQRTRQPIRTTKGLSDIVARIVKNSGKINPATRVFQAIRIEVNDEIGNLKTGLEQGFKLLGANGRLAVISFHSLEDRVVKLYFLKLGSEKGASILTKKPIIAGEEEIGSNRRSRSAKLRILQK